MTYIATVLADSPSHFWRCADPGGLYLADLGATPDALFFNATSALYLPYSGPNTDGGSVTLGLGYFWDNDGVTLAAPISVECWFWQVAYINTFQVLAQLHSAAGNVLAQIGLDATGHPQLNTQTNAVTAAAPATRQHWHHMVATLGGAGALNLYLDAVNVGALAGAVTGSAVYRIAVGGVTAPAASNYQGSIAEFALYPSVLSAARVAAHFAAADNTLARPVFQGSPLFPVASGGVNSGTDLAAIKNAVLTTFVNAP